MTSIFGMEPPNYQAIAILVWGVLFVSLLLLIVLRRPIVRAVLWTSEMFVLISVIIATLIFAALGGLAGYYFITVQGLSPEQAGNIVQNSALMGALLGFFVSLIWASFFLAISQMERNTKHMTKLLEEIRNHQRG